ncbi:MAG: extracellular solute-binding protein, partial [Cytophagaceae bacterium]
MNDSIMAVDKAKDAAELDEQYRADKRLLIADNNARLLQNQRNLIILVSAFLLIAAFAAYRWIIYKKKKEALLLAHEHEQLEKLDALKTPFFANVSHELRTPLTLIMGPADQLLNKQIPGEEEQHESLRAIRRNSKKLLNIVNELLDLGKLEAGKLELNLKPVALAPFVNVLFQAFRSAAEYKKINYQLTCDINKRLFVQLDQDRFEKITNNLVGNAIKFTPDGGSVTVEATITGQVINFTVTNTGMGIHPDDVQHIFDRYYQGHRTEQASEGGTGIGLAIAREFAELMGGSLSIENSWGTGTTFKVSIPLISAEQRDMEISATNIPLKQPVANNKPLVLVVEDNHEMAAYIAGLQVNGFHAGTTNPAEIEKATQSLIEQKKVLGGYNATNFGDLVASGEACIVQGWNGSIAQVMATNPKVKYVIPDEGGSMWIDGFSIPKSAKNVEEAYKFIDYIMRPDVAA